MAHDDAPKVFGGAASHGDRQHAPDVFGAAPEVFGTAPDVLGTAPDLFGTAPGGAQPSPDQSPLASPYDLMPYSQFPSTQVSPTAPQHPPSPALIVLRTDDTPASMPSTTATRPPTGSKNLWWAAHEVAAQQAQDPSGSVPAKQRTRSPLRSKRLSPAGLSRLLCIGGLIGTLTFGVLVVDQLGPKTLRQATVTSRSITVSTHNGNPSRTYHVHGVDDAGATFSVDVSPDAFREAFDGEHITVSRAVLTGRVVEVRNAPWALTSTTFHVVLYGAFGGVSLVMLFFGLRIYRRSVSRTDRNGSHKPLVIMVALAVAVVGGVVIWIFIERGNSDLGNLVSFP